MEINIDEATKNIYKIVSCQCNKLQRSTSAELSFNLMLKGWGCYFQGKGGEEVDLNLSTVGETFNEMKPL